METNATRQYNFEDLRLALGGMPKSTLYNRLNKLAIVPNSLGYYEQADLDLLSLLSQFLTRCHSIEKFKTANKL